MPIAVARAATWAAAGRIPNWNCCRIQAPITKNRVETTSRQKQCQRPRRRERLRLLIQPTMPPTRKAIAKISVIPAEARIGNSRARAPSTSIKMPSATVKLRREPSSNRALVSAMA